MINPCDGRTDGRAIAYTRYSIYAVARKNKANKKAVLSQRWPRDARYISRSWAFAEICHSKSSKMAAAAILNLFESKIAPLHLPSPKTPPYNQTWSGSDDRLFCAAASTRGLRPLDGPPDSFIYTPPETNGSLSFITGALKSTKKYIRYYAMGGKGPPCGKVSIMLLERRQN